MPSTEYWLKAEIAIPIVSRGARWHRSTVPLIWQKAVTGRGVKSLDALNKTIPGDHIVYFNVQDQVRSFGLSVASFWADKHGAYVAGALGNVSDGEKDYIRSHHEVHFKFKCFSYPQYPILYFVMGIPVSGEQDETLCSIADFSDGDLQEFALAVGEQRAFNLHLLDDRYQVIKSGAVQLAGDTCAELLSVFDTANSHFNRLGSRRTSFGEAASSFRADHGSDFWP